MRRPILLAALLGTTVALAQPSSSSTELWVTYMENLDLQFNTPPYFELVISSEVATQGEVQVPATSFTIPFTVGAMSDTVITLPTNIYYPQGDEAIFNFGLKVVADDPVSVYAYHHRLYFSEAGMALPFDRLGTEYLVLAHEDAVNTSPSEFVVLATHDSTEVEIVPSVLTVGFRPPGVPYTVLLHEGQVFQQQAFGDLSGSRVRSLDPAKPVAVFAGARQARTNCQLSADDHLYQQVEPVVNWGRTYHIVPFKARGGDEVRVLSASDNNTITISGQSPVVLDSGEVADLFAGVPLQIQSSAPIAVGQFNDSQNCNPAVGDPCYLWVHPADRKDQLAIWSARTGAGTPFHYVNIVTTAEAGAPQVFLDGANVSPQMQPMAGVAGVFWGQFDVVDGQHIIEGASGFQAWAYGMGDYNSYAFPLGYGTSNISTGIEARPTSSSSGAVLVEQGTVLDRTQLGTRGPLRVFDASGRVVVLVPASRALVADLAPGLYTVVPADGRALRLLVR